MDLSCTWEAHRSGFCIIKISLIKLMLGSQVWIVEKPTMCTFHVYETLKIHTYEQNISLIRLILVMQNPDYLDLWQSIYPHDVNFNWIYHHCLQNCLRNTAYFHSTSLWSFFIQMGFSSKTQNFLQIIPKFLPTHTI